MALLAHLESSGVGAERRGSERHVLRLPVPGSTPSDGGVVVLIHDLSLTGLLIETSAGLSIGDDLAVDIPETGLRHARVVWNSGCYFGCEFHAPISTGVLSAARLRSPAEAAPVADYGETWGDEEKFAPRTRLLILVALVLASWAIVLAVVAILAG